MEFGSGCSLHSLLHLMGRFDSGQQICFQDGSCTWRFSSWCWPSPGSSAWAWNCPQMALHMASWTSLRMRPGFWQEVSQELNPKEQDPLRKHRPSLSLRYTSSTLKLGLPWCLTWSKICLECGRPRFDPWVRKIPWRREWQPTPVFLPGEFHWLRSLVSYSPWSRREPDMAEWLTHNTHTHTLKLHSQSSSVNMEGNHTRAGIPEDLVHWGPPK